MLRWDPESKTSSMSYFLYIIQQRIAWFFTNKLACSNKLTRIDKRFVDCLIKIDENNLKKNKRKTVKEAKEEAEQILKERFDGSEDYKVIRYNATYFAIVHREKLIVRDFSEYEDFQPTSKKKKTTNGKAQSTAKKGKRKREDGGSCGG